MRLLTAEEAAGVGAKGYSAYTYPHKANHLDAFVELTTLINSALDIDEIKRRAIESAMRMTDAEAGSLLFVDGSTGDLYFDVASGKRGDVVKTVRLKKGQGIAGWVAENQLPLIVEDAENDPRFFKKVDERSGFKTRNMVCVPVTARNKLLGVLQVINKKSGMFTSEDMVLMVSFSNQVAIAVENTRLRDELNETFYNTMQALAETIEMRDPYTGGHTRRVMEYSLAIGRRIGLTRREMVRLRLAAILHDIGKIGVRDTILLNPGRLTSEEFGEMRKHPEFGAAVLSRIKKLRGVIPGIKYHHERYDGSGYPEGLKGEAIPLLARIVAVADAFDAMTTNRPYRKGLSWENALAELQKHSGRQFDPAVVKAFLDYFKARRERTPE
ncbi:MAG: HD domain-containing phosphohydrolase [Nitrospirota bacterium]